MSTEKIIRNQAKKSLENNWTVIISAILLMCAILIAAEGLGSFAACIFEKIDFDSGEIIEKNQIAEAVINTVITLMLIALSPIITGIYRMFMNTARYNHTALDDLFYFFSKSELYIKAVIINIISAAAIFIIGYGIDPYFYLSLFTEKTISDFTEFSPLAFGFSCAYIAGILIKVFLYFIFVHYSLLRIVTNELSSIKSCTLQMYVLALKNFGKTFKLLFTFVGWLLLCFFVVPAFYVVPYLGVSMATSAKWIFGINSNGC